MVVKDVLYKQVNYTMQIEWNIKLKFYLFLMKKRLNKLCSKPNVIVSYGYNK